MSTLGDRALGVAVGLLLDRALGEPPDAWHPVAWFGRVMGGVESVLYSDDRARGLAYTTIGASLGAALGLLGRRAVRALPHGWPLDVATAVAVASAGRMLRHTSAQIEDLLRAGDLRGARDRLPWLVGRDPSGLDASGISAAVIESLAENTVDAVLAPAFWGLVAGTPGVLVHRAANTMDAMVGHRTERYARFGWAAARLDDAMAWVPARIFAVLVAVLAVTGHGRRADPLQGPPDAERRGGLLTPAHRVLHLVRRDAPAHPSPNAGVAETSIAAALGIELGGPLRYGDRLERRPRLGEGPRPSPTSIARARGLVDRVELVVVAGTLVAWWRSPQPRTAPSARSRSSLA